MSESADIYLDSQDFSRFSPSHPDYETYAPVKQALLDLKRKGIARFVFSDVHVFEALPTSPENSAPGLERIQTIAELCGEEHLPSAVTLLEYELLQLIGRSPAAIWPEWYPRIEIPEPDRRQISDNLVSKALNRKQRRAFTKLLNSSTSPESSRVFVDEFLLKYPFLRNGKKVLSLYLSRRASWEEVQVALRASMRDIVGFSEWVVANWTYGRRFVENLRDTSQDVQRKLVEFYMNMRALFTEKSANQQDIAQVVKETYNTCREKFLREFASRNGIKIFGPIVGDEAGAPLSAERAPSLFAATQFLLDAAYLSALPSHPRDPQTKAGSDFADALHVLFLPRVDVFRADRFSCSVLRKNKINRTKRLCDSLPNLPALIVDVAAQKRRIPDEHHARKSDSAESGGSSRSEM